MIVRIFEQSISLRLDTLGLDLNSRSGKSRVANQATSPLDRLPFSRSAPTPPDLQMYINRYGEQVAQNPVADLNLYFQRTQNRGFTLGGVSTQLPPLAIGPGDMMPSITAISVIGEGLAGWYLERRSLQAMARPIGETVDLIFRDRRASLTKYALIQVKATQQENIIGQMKIAVPQLLQYGYNAAARASSAYSCYIIGVIIRQSDDYDVKSLEINLI